jgi:hypothetical protein
MNPKLQLHIPTPCHENWNAMTPQAQGRFCNACAKVVVDFSMMTDKEVLDYMNTATSNVCGRMSTEQLAKPLQAYAATRSFGWKYMWSLLVGSFLMTAKSYAQGKEVAQKPKTTQLPPVIRMGAVAYTMKTVSPFLLLRLLLKAPQKEPWPMRKGFLVCRFLKLIAMIT